MKDRILEKDIKQAQELIGRVNKAIDVLDYVDFRESIKDNQMLLFRFEAVHGILVMAYNDISMLIKQWKREEKDQLDSQDNKCRIKDGEVYE